MGLSKEDRILINMNILKIYTSLKATDLRERLMKEFPTKEWKKSTLNDF